MEGKNSGKMCRELKTIRHDAMDIGEKFFSFFLFFLASVDDPESVAYE